MAKRKPKPIRKTADGRPIHSGKKYLLPDRRYRIDCRSTGGGRVIFETEAEADAALEENAAKKSKGEFRASKRSPTFGDALDLMDARNKREGLLEASKRGVESTVRMLRKRFGKLTFAELMATRLKPMKDWLLEERSERDAAQGTLSGYKSVISLACDEALDAGLIELNPVKAFGLKVPQKRKKERPLLTLEEISALVRAVLTRDARDRVDITFSSRAVMVFLALFTPWRDEEICGLCWDQVELPARRLRISRVVRRHEGLVDDTKTGPSGKRWMPLSPITVEVIEVHKERLKSRGYPVEGHNPVLVPGRLSLSKGGTFTTNAIVQTHWPAICDKAGFTMPDGSRKHSFYVLRHVAANMLETLGMRQGDLKRLGGWATYKTFQENYEHDAQFYDVLRREVEALARREPRLNLDLRTPEGMIDGLGYVFGIRWQKEGINVKWAPPRPKAASPLEAALIGEDGADPVPLLISGPTIELAPNRDTAVLAVGNGKSVVEQARLWQIERAKEMFAQGRPKSVIAAKLGVDHNTVGMWMREAEITHKRGRQGTTVLEVQKRELLELHVNHPELGVTELAKATGMRPGRVTHWLRKSGASPALRKMPDYKLGKDEARILAMVEQGKTLRQMAKVLGVSFSAIALFLKKRGLKTKNRSHGQFVDQYDADIQRLVAGGKKGGREITKELPAVSASGINRRIKKLGLKTELNGHRGGYRGRGERIDQYDADIRRMLAQGKDAAQIARELHTVSHGGVFKYIKRLGLNTSADRRANSACARGKKLAEAQRLKNGSGTDIGTHRELNGKKPSKISGETPLTP
ncbi:tyrosine-type recombinase/integrase [Bradyrhizobium sp. Gha]|uniref:tyrosine-type recombinase/integrase n=1 Tax=Bradyrhizobium sp. Gha TaxID=1855318 RepID=UPI0008E52D7C|nr:tyrosine-type recombinase/integrase [Bradyrhizobium sp. Gha]SFJ25475.1 Phage integrase family protein [Bradyrhizobium sp. Gha]